MRGKRLLVGLGILLGTATGTAWGAGVVGSIVGADGTINGCYRTQSGDDVEGRKGQLRAVAAGEGCAKNERPITWSQGGPRGLQGLTGAQGESGAPGPRGDAGPAGISGYEVVEASVAATPGDLTYAYAFCPEGKSVIGGGGSVNGGELRTSVPWVEESAWIAGVRIPIGGFSDAAVSAYAICANVS